MIKLSQSLFVLFSLLLLFFIMLLLLQWTPQIAICSAIILLFSYGLFFGISVKDLLFSIYRGIKIGFRPMGILLLVGVLIGLFISSNFIPYCLFWGLKLFSAQYFLIGALFLSLLVASLTGSSLTTGGTIGVALMAIGSYLGVDPRYCAGAIISGAFFGDKMSPLSDTTNFAPGLIGVDIFTHIKCMLGTTVPSLIISIIFFSFLPVSQETFKDNRIDQMLTLLQENFSLNSFVLIIPFVMIILSIMRISSFKLLSIILLLALSFSLYFQTSLNVISVLKIIVFGFTFDSSSSELNALLTRGGLVCMLPSLGLITLALSLGGLIDKMQLIPTILNRISKIKMNKGILITITSFFCLLINILTGEQYLSIFIPGLGFKNMFEKLQVPLKYLSRTLEDSGTLVNPLIPWSVTGVFFSQTLGVKVIDYFPYCIFIFGCYFFTIFLGFIKNDSFCT